MMKPLPLAALVATASVSTLIVLDVIWNAEFPDQPGPWVDPDGFPALTRFLSGVHAALYALLAAGLFRYGAAIDGGRRFVMVVRWVVASGYGVFALLYAWLVIDPTFGVEGVYGVIWTAAFAISLLVPIVLGFALVRRREFRVPSILLVSPVVIFPLVLLLEAFTVWAHPGYLEIAVNFGVALLCLAASGVERMPPTNVETPSAGHATAAA